MTSFVVIVGITIFCVLQASFWFRRSREVARESDLLQRLGGASAMQDMTLLRRTDDESSLLGKFRMHLRLSGETGEIFPFMITVLNWVMIFGFLGLVAGQTLATAVIGMLLGVCFPMMRLSQRRRQRLREIEKTLPEALQVLIISLKSGHAMPKAIATTAAETNGPLQEELQVLADELRLGRTVEDGFMRLGQRLRSLPTMRTFVVAVVILQQTGGNLIEVLEQIVDVLHEQTQYARKLAAMTAEGRMSARILCGLPPVFLGLTSLAAPDYVGKLFNNVPGLVIFCLAMGLYLAGFFWVRRLVDPGGPA